MTLALFTLAALALGVVVSVRRNLPNPRLHRSRCVPVRLVDGGRLDVDALREVFE